MNFKETYLVFFFDLPAALVTAVSFTNNESVSLFKSTEIVSPD